MYFVVVPDVYVQGVKGDTFYYVAQSAKELPSAWEDQLYERCSNSQLQEYSSCLLYTSVKKDEFIAQLKHRSKIL